MAKISYYNPSLFSRRESLPLKDYLISLEVTARRGHDLQRPKAQFEMALLGFRDLSLLSEITDKQLDFSQLTDRINFNAGFDWLDLAVGNNYRPAVSYFIDKLEHDRDFQQYYQFYKTEVRPDCKLRNYELRLQQYL